MGKVCVTKFVVMGLLGVAAFMVALMPGTAQARHCAAIIYEHANYEGAAQCLQEGSYNVGDLEIGNDALSSLKVSGGNVVILFEHSNYSGRSARVTGNKSYVGDKWNDTVSSIIVE
ncbi:hypothetical protein LJC09_05160 [Desulfovibrio sp. OttesenSCG-928-F20]|nr:hypothetical protein [Desulfovibrio sp. OttesenSCG-928-M16]MDL2291473.1 hypothetical protein [Desulfovibrio sp. OttesenSCG-928-F20]